MRRTNYTTSGSYHGDAQVRECAAARQISAHLVCKKMSDGCLKIIATVHFALYRSGRVRCDVWNEKTGTLSHQGVAGGYGYDKKTSALIGAEIDGHMCYDHCGQLHVLPEGMEAFPHKYIVPEGYHLANWSPQKNGWEQCYRYAGLDFFRHHKGYTVEDVI